MAYSSSTIRRAEQILGYGIGDFQGVREYPVIDGVIYTDLFEGDLNVELPFEYKLAFNGKIGHTAYHNEIIVKSKCKSSVEVDAVWGSCEFNKEIEPLLDWLKSNPVTDSLDNAGTKSIRIKDTAETFSTGEEQTQAVNDLLNSGYGYYIRKPLIISFGENNDAARYF